MSKFIWFLAILLLSGYLTTTFPRSSLETVQQPPNQITQSEISLGYSNWAGWWPWAIAESQNLFEKHDLKVDLKWYDNYTQSLEDLASGYIDANSQTLSDTIAFESQAVKGEVIVLVNDNSAGNDKVIVNPEIKEVSDLRGKTVAVEGGVVSDFLLSLALDQANVSRKDIKILNAETGAAVEAFVAGQADSVVAFPPFWKKALAKIGAHEISSSKDFPGAIPDLLVVSQELAENQKEDVQELIKVWFEILAWIDENPVEAQQIMAERAEVERSEMKELLKGTRMFDLKDNLIAFERSISMRSLYGASSKISHFLEVKPHHSKLIKPQFIRAYARSTKEK